MSDNDIYIYSTARNNARIQLDENSLQTVFHKYVGFWSFDEMTLVKKIHVIWKIDIEGF